MTEKATVLQINECPWETFDGQQPLPGAVRWRHIINRDHIDSHGINMGLLELPPGKVLKPHLHAPQEIYWIHQGEGVLTLGEATMLVKPGHVVYVPKRHVHGIENTGNSVLQLMWVFPTDTWSEVEYHYVSSETPVQV